MPPFRRQFGFRAARQLRAGVNLPCFADERLFQKPFTDVFEPDGQSKLRILPSVRGFMRFGWHEALVGRWKYLERLGDQVTLENDGHVTCDLTTPAGRARVNSRQVNADLLGEFSK